MLLNQPLRKSGAIFVLGSRDERVAAYAARLFLEGYADWLIISGGVAHSSDLLRAAWGNKTEAQHFGDIAINLGVPSEKIILEEHATNTGENITLTHALLRERQLSAESFILVQKPYMERRTFATFSKLWPEQNVSFVVTSPPLSYDLYFDEQNPKEDILNIMVGDLQRIKEYPKRGFQIEQDIPENVWRAYEFLVAAGYIKHLIR